ncbi:G protein-coupled glucose receptor regulating Gpa2 C-term-domain-containing protein [Terfezia claveryi]|nr:G protein-coupled glucose receptor regulating Gpa2 C-term-domain-containing protein [Terfezia claveryi]
MDPEFNDPVMTHRELLILRSIAIFAASISLTSGLLVGYWFIRMKRSFRHHLIMLLICSDFWKASWQLIYPAVVIKTGNADKGFLFCQVTGFFISMGIEASGGLFRYRFYLYTIWVAFPLLMASLAFLNTSKAYTSQGAYCYLPARPIWMLLALAWIPRYLILVTIWIKFRTFRTNIGPSVLDMHDVDHSNLPTNSAPDRLPDLHSHGLIPESPETGQGTSASDEPFVKISDPPRVQGKLRRFFGAPTALPSTSGPIDGPTATAELVKRRYVIRRQLRLLFIYPLVYALMWVPPLISNSLQYNKHFAHKPSFPLQCIVSFTLPIQCAVDCWLFATREKPWKYIPHTGRKTFWFSFVFWRHDCGHDHDGARCPQGVWRNTSRRSMSIEQRAAYMRREAERKEAEEKRRLSRRVDGESVELGRISEEGGGEVGGEQLTKQRKGSVASTQTAATGGTAPRVVGGGNWWDKLELDYPDEEEEDELQRGRKHNSGILSALEVRHAMSSSDVTVRDDSSNSGKRYGSGIASGRGSRSVSASAATSTTKRDSGSTPDECLHSMSGWGGNTPVEYKELRLP